eukprot:7443605-Karenia_brevis.AAC.1
MGIKKGGLGLRGAHEHASAAFLASIGMVRSLCQSIDDGFDFCDPLDNLGAEHSRSEFIQRVLPEAAVDLDNGEHSQKYLSGLIDARLE